MHQIRLKYWKQRTCLQNITFKGLKEHAISRVPVNSGARTVKYCIRGSYLVAIQVSKTRMPVEIGLQFLGCKSRRF